METSLEAQTKDQVVDKEKKRIHSLSLLEYLRALDSVKVGLISKTDSWFQKKVRSYKGKLRSIYDDVSVNIEIEGQRGVRLYTEQLVSQLDQLFPTLIRDRLEQFIQTKALNEQELAKIYSQAQLANEIIEVGAKLARAGRLIESIGIYDAAEQMDDEKAIMLRVTPGGLERLAFSELRNLSQELKDEFKLREAVPTLLA